MANGKDQQQQPQQKGNGFKMANLTKWIGPLIIVGVIGYGAWAFANKKWPFDGSFMLPSISSLLPTADGGGGLGDGTTGPITSTMTSTGDTIRQIQHQVMTSTGGGATPANAAAIRAQVQAKIAAAQAQAQMRAQAILAKFPQAPKHTLTIPGVTA
jgi:hypothetical protein